MRSERAEVRHKYVLNGVELSNRAFSPVLPPPLPDAAGAASQALDSWLLQIPGLAIWSRYAILCASLRDVPGVPPAFKDFEEATHELIVLAIHPDVPSDKFEEGCWSPYLTPINFVRQVCCESDEKMNRVTQELARQCVMGQLWPEMESVRVDEIRMRDLWNERITELLARK